MAKARKQGRNTKQLQLIWDAVKDDKSHPTADQIYDRVRKKMPNISLGTVYRNLQKLVGDEKLQDAYDANHGFPTTFVIDASGNIKRRILGANPDKFRILQSVVDEALSERS